MPSIKNDLDMGFVITDNKLNVLYCNEYFKKNVVKTDILNKKITMFFHDINVDKDKNLYSVKNKDNSVYYVIHNKFKLYNHDLFNFFFYDFTIGSELQKQIERLNSQQYLYNEMLNKLQDGIYITDERGTTIYANDAFLNLSGLTRDQIIGNTVYDLRKSNILPNSCCAKVIETLAPVSTINHYYKGQRCLVSGSPIFDEKGNLAKTIAVIRDVTELDMLMKTIAKEQNLFFRLNVITLVIPDLCKRIDDIPLLVEHFIEKYNKKCNKYFSGVSKEVLDIFLDYSWPGNVRELEHAIESAISLYDAEIIREDHLPFQFKNYQVNGNSLDTGAIQHLNKAVEKVERKIIISALEQTDYNITKAAKLINIPRQTLQYKIKKLDILF
jgi:PAS domain S-box-containing protein